MVHSDRTRVGSIYKSSWLPVGPVQMLGDLRAGTRAKVGLSSIFVITSCSQSSGSDHDLWVNKAESAIFRSAAQLLKLLNYRCSKGESTGQISESWQWLQFCFCCRAGVGQQPPCVKFFHPKTAFLCQHGDVWVRKGKKNPRRWMLLLLSEMVETKVFYSSAM